MCHSLTWSCNCDAQLFISSCVASGFEPQTVKLYWCSASTEAWAFTISYIGGLPVKYLTIKLDTDDRKRCQKKKITNTFHRWIVGQFDFNMHSTDRIQNVSLSKNCTYICFDINDCQSTKSCQCDTQSRNCVGGLLLYSCQEQAGASSSPKLFKSKLLRSKVTYIRSWPVCTSCTEESVSSREKKWEMVLRQKCSRQFPSRTNLSGCDSTDDSC